MLTKIQITSLKAPKALGPYSQAIKVGDRIYLSGQLGLDPETMEFTSEDVLEQAKLVFKHIQSILEDSFSDLDHVVKVEIFLTDMNDFPIINELYGEIFHAEIPPVRQTIEVSALPKWAKIMVSCEAVKKL